MNTATKIKFSEHAIRDRGSRIATIATTIGFGNIVQTFHRVNHHGPCIHQITDSGIVIIKTPDEKEVITCYAITLEKLKGYYEQIESKPPTALIKTVMSNQKKRKFLFENS